jgi:chaperonin GroES
MEGQHLNILFFILLVLLYTIGYYIITQHTQHTKGKTMLRPIKDKLVVKLIEKEKTTSSGIVLSHGDPAEVTKATVIAVGPDVSEVVQNDIILPDWNKAVKTNIDGEEYYVLTEENIVAVFIEA